MINDRLFSPVITKLCLSYFQFPKQLHTLFMFFSLSTSRTLYCSETHHLLFCIPGLFPSCVSTILRCQSHTFFKVEIKMQIRLCLHYANISYLSLLLVHRKVGISITKFCSLLQINCSICTYRVDYPYRGT